MCPLLQASVSYYLASFRNDSVDNASGGQKPTLFLHFNLLSAISDSIGSGFSKFRVSVVSWLTTVPNCKKTGKCAAELLMITHISSF